MTVKESSFPTTEELWSKTIKEIRKSGVAIKQNVKAATRGSVDIAKSFPKIDAEVDPYAFNFGGQGLSNKWVNDVMVYVGSPRAKSSKIVDKVYFTHANKSAAVIKQAFEKNGFTVEWNGSDDFTVLVYPNGKRVEY